MLTDCNICDIGPNQIKLGEVLNTLTVKYFLLSNLNMQQQLNL